ncbi:hypothetical protein [Halobacterium zhouii]|uniref:hypothetical protein n=1 Tax=Halobacterium zhouii TaxID=2902624 RepID=UPI001E439CE0|nr:hypothetical protein [Halobacterium zhouii]
MLTTVAAISLSPVVPLDWAAADVSHPGDARDVDAVATNDAFDYAQDDHEEGEENGDEEGEENGDEEGEEKGDEESEGDEKEERKEEKEERKEEKEERKEEREEEKEERKKWWKESDGEDSGDEDELWLDFTGTVPTPIPDRPEKPPSTPPVTVTVTPPTATVAPTSVPTPSPTPTETPTATLTTTPRTTATSPTTTAIGGGASPTDDVATTPPATAPPPTQSTTQTTNEPPTSTASGDGVVDVTVNKSTVQAGKPVGVVATVANAASESRSFTLELHMFGEVIAVRDVDVPAGETRTVTFVREIEAPGKYTAAVDGVTATVVVESAQLNDAGATTDASDLDTSIRTPLGTLLPLVALAAALALAFRRS